MPVTYIVTNQIGPGPVVDLGATAAQMVVVAQGVTVGTTGTGNAIFGTGTGQGAFIHGFVGAQGSAAVRFNGNSAFVTVGATGTVQALETMLDASGTAAIFLPGTDCGVSNQGAIRGDFGILITGEGIVVNSGVIEAYTFDAITIGGVGTVTNTGTIIGDIAFNGGSTADVYNGDGGTLIGTVSGGSGNDTLTGGAFADNFFGGTDNDTLRGNGGIDSLQGDAGNDTIFFSIEDATVDGGSGSDTARNTYNDFGLTFDMGANSIEFYFGSQAGETIVTSADVRMDVDAGGGNDLIIGGGQGDGLAGGGGDDTIFGGLGPDTIGGGFGDDRIESGGGNDVLNGESGNDTFVYEGVGGGNDTINGFEIGRDKIEILRSGFLSPTQWNAGALDPARFVASAAPAPILGTACFLFDNAGPGAGQVFWNDGTGGATGIFQVTGINFAFFSAQDFVLI